MVLQNDFGQELLLNIRRSMRQGDIDAVYHTLIPSTFTHAEEICLQYKKDLERLQKGDIDVESWCLEQINNFDIILHWPEFQESQEASQEDLDKKLLVRLVNSFELDKALQLCESLGDSSIIMQAQHKIFEKFFREGKIEIEIWELIRHSTQYQLWELANAKSSHSNFFLKAIRNIKIWLKVL
jgi:hypothetical protein